VANARDTSSPATLGHAGPVLASSRIESLVVQGFRAAEIAEKIGCKLGTVRVKCSQNGVRLRCRKASPAASKGHFPRRLKISLSQDVAADFQRQADKMGMSKADLAAAILDAIARDNLYDAVMGQNIEPKRHKASPVSRRSKVGSD
jgi:hypothetical protein